MNNVKNYLEKKKGIILYGDKYSFDFLNKKEISRLVQIYSEYPSLLQNNKYTAIRNVLNQSDILNKNNLKQHTKNKSNINANKKSFIKNNIKFNRTKQGGIYN